MFRIKYLLLLTLSASVIFSCKVEPEPNVGVGYDILGEWKMLSFQVNGEEKLFPPDDVFKMVFTDYDGNEGYTVWRYSTVGGGSVTNSGRYRIEGNEKALRIFWSTYHTVFSWSLEMDNTINMHNDTMVVKFGAPGKVLYIEAVRQ